MDERAIFQKIEAQRRFFAEGKTRLVAARREALLRLRRALRAMEGELADALRADLGKSATESYMCEIGMALDEIGHMLRHMKRYARRRRARTPMAQFAARSWTQPCPYGVTLIMSPWNYPLLLTLDPVIDAVAAGNTCVVKPSAYAPETAKVIAELIRRSFPEEWVCTVLGGRAENAFLLDCEWDKIFFTGSVSVGRLVMEKAARHLTPVTLELGGKSPCLVDETADVELAARRIVFGKFLNVGQTCVAPDYVYCDEKIREPLVAAMKREIVRQYGENPLANENYGKMVSEKHFDRVLGLLDREKVVIGGQSDRARLRIAPTILDGATFDDAAMGEEIFGPVLPVVTFRSLDEALKEIDARPHPLALYCFSKDKGNQARVMDSARFGGGCINDTIIHLATTHMPFGGVGLSGMGAYHGRAGFEAFSHMKSIVDKKNWIDLPIRYAPYSAAKEKWIRRFLK